MGYNNIPTDIKNYLPGEFLTDSDFQPSNTNFLTGNKSIFLLSRCPNIAFFCQRANIPSVSAGVSIQNNPNAIQIQRPGTEITEEDLQIGFAVDENMSNWLEIFRWIKDISVYGTYIELLRENQKVSDAILLVLNSAYRPIIKVKYYDIFPTYLAGIDFDTSLPDTDNIISSVTFAYNYFDIQLLS
jgi:hypothetical protein